MPFRLADYPFWTIRLTCRKCPRGGNYRKTTLVELYGPDANLIDLRLVLAADCPRVVIDKNTDHCGIFYPDLRPK